MKAATKLMGVMASLALILGGMATEANAQVNGRNVQLVVSGDAYGNRLGTLRNMGDGTWMEDSFNGRQGTHRFRETGRDQWSVYLHDASRGVDLQIDLYLRSIKYRDNPNQPMVELYKVADAKAGPTGRTVSRVDYNDAYGSKPGYFVQRGREWFECNSDGQNCFRELNRDDWSVYLIDDSRGIQIQLDLYTKQVNIGHGSFPNQNLYRVTSAR